jgi:hypothetical protein
MSKQNKRTASSTLSQVILNPDVELGTISTRRNKSHRAVSNNSNTRQGKIDTLNSTLSYFQI